MHPLQIAALISRLPSANEDCTGKSHAEWKCWLSSTLAWGPNAKNLTQRKPNPLRHSASKAVFTRWAVRIE